MSKDKKYLDNLRHSASHLLAAAVLELYPKAKPTLGPSIKNGFYYDFDNLKISNKDFVKIEKRMHKIVASWTEFKGEKVTKKQALEEFGNNKYKKELIEQFSKEKIKLSIFQAGDFRDLCRGGHIENPKKELQHFKLLSVAGAYWRGDEKNKMLTRIYGTAFPTKSQLTEYLVRQEEAKKRDHKKIGKALDLFLFSQDVGPGLPIYTPKGNTIRREIESFLIAEKESRGYEFIWTPHIAKSDLYKKSGHWAKYDAMFSPMKIDDDEYVVKPMNCPHHFQVYLNRPRSYRELPMRLSQNGTVYRYEKSGELNGLIRVRALTIDDTHSFVTADQVASEIDSILDLIESVFKIFGFKKFEAMISVRDKKNKKGYLGNNKTWDKAEAALISAAKRRKMDYVIGKGEAAFYGPKIDVMVKDSLGRSWQLSTCQLDFNQPKNFKMTYIDEKGKQVRPAILHVAVVGSLDRFMGILIENFEGALPVWLSPVQAKILPITQRNLKYAGRVSRQLKELGIRVEINEKNETLQAKIRNAQLQKIPYMLILGDKELKAKKITLRLRDGKNVGEMSLDKFSKLATEKIESRALDLV